MPLPDKRKHQGDSELPKLLVNRLGDDTITEFRAAAQIRNEDARQLADSGRTTAAVYLWGYAAEMTLKAAWFSLLGTPSNTPIPRKDLHAAMDMAKRTYGIQWKGGLHNLLHWAELLVEHRIGLGRRYPDRRFEIEVVSRSRQIYERWRETLRYKTNRPYPAELRVVSESAVWLLSNALRL